MRVEIDRQTRSFTKNGDPFFYQADTLWMAFSKLSLSEWEEILRVRRAQRFTVLQISVLPIAHDNSGDDNALMPFATREDGTMDFHVINETYFDHACEMLSLAVKYGFVPCLHLLWVNYVPGTWGARVSPATVMPLDAVQQYLRYFVKRVLPYEVMYSISGDTDFTSDEMTNYYLQAMRIVREIDPQGLITLHLVPHADVPDVICNSGLLDFYTYQAGHGHSKSDQENSVQFARFYWNKPGAKPVVNSEPPYDGHGYGNEYGRYNAFDIRRCMWQSLLSGAHAGITYGAHGLWSMHREGQIFNNVSFSGQPFDWRTALRLNGAWEPGQARMLYERLHLFDLVPMNSVLTNNGCIVMAGKRDQSILLIYTPYPSDVEVDFDLEPYNIVAMDMENKHFLASERVFSNGKTVLTMPQCNADILYIATLKHPAKDA